MYRNVFLGAILLSMPLVVWSQQDTIADQRLEEIMVTAKLPLVEISAGKTSYRMDASVTQSTGSLYDVLASLPGVVIDSNGNILLNGQSGATILMDGKPTYLSGDELMSLLKSTPATNADKIDLITQPSARHDAAGSSGLIDIRTRKIRLRGVNLALNGNGSLGRTGSGYGGASMNIRENKFNLYLNYSYYQGKDVIDLFIEPDVIIISMSGQFGESHWVETFPGKGKMQACLRKSKKSELREILTAMRSKTGIMFLPEPVWCTS